ncbi:unnamed protein product [Rotaria magnacalcarata]|uniref:Uncharacterized protein n=1 Tax=Rotaria magnacalcarata TaxID=392030 RepID=A0A816MUX2_9BILA|nr:unnamed protein product [Rotaria magnacalcarata]CAF2006010.1 unnamed protein product [Rotaria magnacalcarata]CAF3878381.1 unnamed protein product [Rotaria magnacalcarata]CAF5186538.1 unnamed protein product [Rotaria magnacalcarata]
MINVNELNLSFVHKHQRVTRRDAKSFQISKALTKIHLESVVKGKLVERFSSKSKEIIDLLLLFKQELKSLTLIIFSCCDEEFTGSDKLRNNFLILLHFNV